MHVERKRRRGGLRARVIRFEIVGAEIIFPDGGRGITGVTGTGTIIFLEGGVGELADLEFFRRFHRCICRSLFFQACPFN
jgi:hypothetical protein